MRLKGSPWRHLRWHWEPRKNSSHNRCIVYHTTTYSQQDSYIGYAAERYIRPPFSDSAEPDTENYKMAFRSMDYPTAFGKSIMPC